MARVAFLVALFLARPALAGDGLDVREWLSRPGVKLLAVEFYASWCGPCKKAVPQWKKLHEAYRDRGLRLVVVSVQDPDGQCVNPGWNPDDVVCDTEGHLAESWGVGDSLPKAFLWSWRGSLLVRGGHIHAVEQAVEEELGRLPRVTLAETMESGLRDLLRTELARTGKVDVVAGQDENDALAEIRKQSHDVSFSERSTCKLGERLAANSLLKSSFVKAGNGKRLLVQLFSAETGCLNASAGVFWNEERPELSVAEAVTELLSSLRVKPELPGTSNRASTEVRERVIGEEEKGWEMENVDGIIVAFETDPPGAVVLLDGKVLCQASPCSKLTVPGSHTVEFQLESYLPKHEKVEVSAKARGIKRNLTPDFGWLTVRSDPSGLPVKLDGQPWGTTPVVRRQVASGPRRVLVSDHRYYDKGKEVVVKRGEHEEVEVKLAPREGGLKVQARDPRGNDLQADVLLDGVRVGTTPFSGKVLIGTRKLSVVLDDKVWEKSVVIKEQQVERVLADLDSAGKTAKLPIGPEDPRNSPFRQFFGGEGSER
jgi:hypothetical protein